MDYYYVMTESIFLELWVHGTAGSPEKPCGEVDVFSVSGGKISADILKVLVSDKIPSLKGDWFLGLEGFSLPTEKCLLVEVKDVSTGDGLWLDVMAWSYCD